MMRPTPKKQRPIRPLALVEAFEARRLLSTVAPAYANQIGLTGVVASQTSFEDNFDGTSLDKTKWQVRDGPRWRAYPDAPISTFSYTGEDSLEVKDGALSLIGYNDPVTGKLNAAMIQTAGHFSDQSRNAPVPPATLLPGYSGDFDQTYGYWESRAKFSSVSGEWAAFWVHSYRMVEIRDDPTKVGHPEVFGTEMDIAEHSQIHRDAVTSYMVDNVIHADGYNSYASATGASTKTQPLAPSYSFPDQYHVYGMLWTPTSVSFYVDGNLSRTVTDPKFVSHVPEMVILSLDIGAGNSLEDGKGANNRGLEPAEGYGTKETSQARATFDYVRVWPLAGQPTIDPSTPSTASGAVYVESDLDEYWEKGENGLSGATVFADYDKDGLLDNGEPSTTTGAGGFWKLTNLPAHQRISVRVVPPGGYKIVNPDTIQVSYITEPGLDHGMTNYALTPGTSTTPTPGGDPQLAGSVIGTSGSFNNSGNTIAKAFDNNLATYVDLQSASGGWSGLDLGSTQKITRVRYAPRATVASRMVGGRFQASNAADFSGGVVTLATVSAAPPEGVLTSLAVDSGAGYRYVRYIGPDGSYGNVAEAQFFGVPAAPPSTPTPPAAGDPQLAGTVIGTGGSYNNSGNTSDKAFDNNLASYVDLASANGGWSGLDLGSAKQVTQIRYAPRATVAGRMVGGRFQASNTADFTGDVVTLATISSAPVEGSLTSIAINAPAGYRYVRYIGPNGSYGNIAEAQFFGVAGTPPPVTQPPTPSDPRLTGSPIGTSGSYNNSGNTIAKAFDNNLASYVDLPVASGGWSGLDLGAAKRITEIRYAARATFAGRMVGGRFQGSDVADFSSGVADLATVSSAPPEGTLTSVKVSNPTGFRYVRYIGPNGSYGNIAEMQAFGVADSQTPSSEGTKLAGTAIGTSGSYNNGGNTIAKAFDDDLNSYVDLAAASGGWSGLDLGAARQIGQIKYAPRSGWASRMLGGRFQASSTADFSAGVVDLATITATPTVGVLTSASVSSAGSFRYVRYIGPNGSYGNIAEMQIFGVAQTLTAASLKATLASAETKLLAYDARATDATRFPQDATGATWNTSAASGWTSGFYAGSIWQLAAQTGDAAAITAARRWTAGLAAQQYDTSSHDLGFQLMSSFGNGYALTGDASYKSVLLNAASSLASRFDPATGVIRSWDWTGGANEPVIVDSLMNLELLLWADKNGGTSPIAGYTLSQIAISHADEVLANHVRADGSTFHVVEFDPTTGAARDPVAYAGYKQAYSTTSTWSRGQAWAMDGFAMLYRETGLARYLAAAQKTADYFIANLPADGVPPADFAYGTAGVPYGVDAKDATAGAIAAAALTQLGTLAGSADRSRYAAAAATLLGRLTDPAYLSLDDTFAALLKHGSQNAATPNDAGFVYGDYYLIDAISRYLALPNIPATP